tara:strand:+ start:61120 stop:61680 length:561 start_codon:yes stop_codon:yes gene_type:complete
MIIIEDNFLDEKDFAVLQDYCKQEFQIVKAGAGDQWKEFLVIDTPEVIREQLELDDHRIILTFIRKAHKDFDTDPRIHSDGIINNQYVDVASVLYINESEGVYPRNGTMFYEHRIHGEALPKDVTGEVYNEVLRDSNHIGRFRETDRVYAKPNRLLSYPAQKFHAKFPPKIEKGERIVLVTFYSEI